jgi:hypothetical protein
MGGGEASGPGVSKCHTENVPCFNKDWEGAQIGENGLRRPWAPELANVIKRMCHISGGAPELGKSSGEP